MLQYDTFTTFSENFWRKICMSNEQRWKKKKHRMVQYKKKFLQSNWNWYFFGFQAGLFVFPKLPNLVMPCLQQWLGLLLVWQGLAEQPWRKYLFSWELTRQPLQKFLWGLFDRSNICGFQNSFYRSVCCVRA